MILDGESPEYCSHGYYSGDLPPRSTGRAGRRARRTRVVWTEEDHRLTENTLAESILRERAEFVRRQWYAQFPPEQRLAMGGKLPADYPTGGRSLPHDYELPFVFIDEVTGESNKRLDPNLLDPDNLAQLRRECPSALADRKLTEFAHPSDIHIHGPTRGTLGGADAQTVAIPDSGPAKRVRRLAQFIRRRL